MIETNEGFREMPYKDSRGYWTIGYGTKLPITKEEGELLLKYRLNKAKKDLLLNKPFVERLPINIQEVLYEMAYQLGVDGLLDFKKMWLAIENQDWNGMIKEMIDSRWYKQTPNRVKNLIKRITNGN